LTPEDQAAITKFRANPKVQELLKPKHNDFYVCRYLRARKFVVDDAVEMFVASMKWRSDVKADDILTSFPKNKNYQRLLDYWPGSIHWDDPPLTHDGSIVLFQALGRASPSLIDAIGMDDLVQFHIWSMERLESKWFQKVEALGFWPGFVMIEDLNGAGWHTFSSQVLKVAQEITRINVNFYPDMLRKMWITNVPSVFSMFWKGIEMVLEPRTLQKINLTNTDAELRPHLLQVIDPVLLPARLGGSSTKDIGLGGEVGKPSRKMRDKVAAWVDVAPGAYLDIKVDLTEGDILSWEFKTQAYNIGFAIFFGPQKKVVKASERYDGDKRLITGSIVCPSTGQYLLQFDNYFSWTTRKQLKYNFYRGETKI